MEPFLFFKDFQVVHQASTFVGHRGLRLANAPRRAMSGHLNLLVQSLQVLGLRLEFPLLHVQIFFARSLLTVKSQLLLL
eukprot:Skav213403  [mRNA]  locus=scaffold797:656196:658613:+ [translate_table: standard]